MKRLCTIAALAAGLALAAVTSKAGLPSTEPSLARVPDRVTRPIWFEFNTGGEMLTPATDSGWASGWGYYILHAFDTDMLPPYHPLQLMELGFPTNEYSSEPVAMPVEWVIYFGLGNQDISAIGNPYDFNWSYRGTFYPAGAPDTAPPDTYTVISVEDQLIMIYDWRTMF